MTTYHPINQRIFIRIVRATSSIVAPEAVQNHPDDRFFVEAVAPDAVCPVTKKPIAVPGDELLLVEARMPILDKEVPAIGDVPAGDRSMVHVSAIAAIIKRNNNSAFQSLS